jgi:hypothetical protein
MDRRFVGLQPQLRVVAHDQFRGARKRSPRDVTDGSVRRQLRRMDRQFMGALAERAGIFRRLFELPFQQRFLPLGTGEWMLPAAGTFTRSERPASPSACLSR